MQTRTSRNTSPIASHLRKGKAGDARFSLLDRYGTQLEMGTNYDGIGKSDFESYGANLRLSIPLQ